MKIHLLLTVACLTTLVFLNTNAQTNTFPSSGNVGIGTTSPSTIFQVDEGPARLQFTQGSNEPTLSFLRTSSSGWLHFNLNYADIGFKINNNSGEFRMSNPSGGWFPTFYSNGYERMRIATDGNVGIGTTSPLALLGVQTTATGTPTALSLTTTQTDANPGVGLAFGSGSNISGASRVISNRTGASGEMDIALQTSNTTRLHVGATTGNVGIGTTSPGFSGNSARFFAVSGESLGTNSFAEIGSGGNITSTNSYVGTFSFYNSSLASTEKRVAVIAAQNQGSTNNANIQFYTQNNSSLGERMRISPDGNVGIGTISPYDQLDITKSTAAGMGGRLVVTNSAAAGVNNTVALGFKMNANFGSTYYSAQIQNINTSGNDGRLGFFLYDATLAGGVEKMSIISNTGNVGIGTTSPSEKLDINGNIKSTGFILPTGAASGKVLTSDGSGNATWQTASGGSSGWSYNGNTVGALKKIGTTDNYDLPIITNNLERMRVLANGSVVIGTSAVPASDAKLAVDGYVYSKKSIVTQIGWADYVFHPTYQLPSLTEVEAYIKQHQHLKDIPSAEEVEKKGLDLGDMSKNLLKKIEELTLYMIDMKKENENLRKKVSQLEKSINQK